MIWEDNVFLMADPYLVDDPGNTSLVREEAFKLDANPIIDESDRSLFLGREGYRIWIDCLCVHQGRHLMFYRFLPYDESDLAGFGDAPKYAGLAESDDGVKFKPVEVGRVEHEGSKKNNLLRITDPSDTNLRASGIMYDSVDGEYPFKALVLRKGSVDDVNPALKAKYPAEYAAAASNSHHNWFVWGIAKSADGIDWTLPENDKNLVDAGIEGPSLYRALDGGYVISNQCFSKVSDVGGRKIKGWVTYDMETAHRLPDFVFALPEHATRVVPSFKGFRTTWDDTQWAQSHVQLIPARKGPSMLALHGYLYGATAVETFAQVSDVGLAVSDTGYWFKEVSPFQAFIRRGSRGAWDYGLVAQQAMVDYGDETRFYYLASSVGNAGGCHYRIGLASIPRDRFAYRCVKTMRNYKLAESKTATFSMKPLTLPDAPKLAVNAENLDDSKTVRCEIRGLDGSVLPGFSLEECLPVNRDSLKAPFLWRNADPASLAGREVQLTLELSSAECQFADRDSPRVYAVYTA